MRYAIRGVVLVPLLVLMVVAGAGGLAGAARAEEPTVVSGTISFVSEDAVELGGQRGIIDSSTDVRSGGHPISAAALRRGMRGTMELDAAGRALEIEVTGVVE